MAIPRHNYSVVQLTRQMGLHHACGNQTSPRRQWADLSPLDQSAVAQRVLVSREHKLLFCPIPLAAKGHWMKLFYLLGPGKHLKSANKIPAGELANQDSFEYLSSFSSAEQSDMVSSYLKFMIARHPFLRIAAAYKMKFETENAFFHERYGKEIVQRFREGATGEETGNNVKFTEFVEYVLSLENENEMNEHWQPQDVLCRPCEMSYDFILHHETLEDDTSELLAVARLLNQVPSLSTDTWDLVPIEYVHKLFQQIMPSRIGKLVQMYHKDFAMFSYTSLF